MSVMDHVGRWTDRIPDRTTDELHTDVVAHAYAAGMKPDPAEAARFNRYVSWMADHYPLSGTAELPDLAWSGDLEAIARRAVDWLNANAPDGRRFWLGDALYCEAA